MEDDIERQDYPEFYLEQKMMSLGPLPILQVASFPPENCGMERQNEFPVMNLPFLMFCRIKQNVIKQYHTIEV